ncbi:MAG: chemotaxis protein CheD [Verrucomicrobia bacterium]|nr:chemotaxis protein CheD [Verrucomicrobiota bacterium]
MSLIAGSFSECFVVGVGDVLVTNNIFAEVATYSLGSCLGITLHDPVGRIGGLLHVMLPDSSIDPAKARKSPSRFVDTGVPLLFRMAYQLGAEKSRIALKVIGGASVGDLEDFFRIGEKNYEALKRILDRAGVLIRAEQVGGDVSRTIFLSVATGILRVKTPGREDLML